MSATEFYTKAKVVVSEQAKVIRWMMIFYFILFTLGALASCMLASLIGATWVTLDTQGKIEIGLAVFVNWSTVMLAFFNKSIGRVEHGQSPIAPDDTNLFSPSPKITTAQPSPQGNQIG